MQFRDMDANECGSRLELLNNQLLQTGNRDPNSSPNGRYSIYITLENHSRHTQMMQTFLLKMIIFELGLPLNLLDYLHKLTVGNHILIFSKR